VKLQKLLQKSLMVKDYYQLMMCIAVYTLKKISEREDQYLYVARRTFTNLFLGVTYVYRDAGSLKN
jgi:hypothetical protein